MGVIIGLDIGGTFTDVVALDQDSNVLFSTKVPSTHADLVDGFIRGVQRVLALAGRAPDDVERIIHGTTIATNAVLEHRGAVIGILTTAGFEDTLIIGRQFRSEMYDLFIDAETPTFLAPRRRIRGVSERIGADGTIVTPLDEATVLRLVGELIEEHAIEALAVSYLFSFANPAHEQRTRALVHAAYPTLPISLSSLVDPKFREYERLVVTAFDAYVRPVCERYLGRLKQELERSGLPTDLFVMQSRGGITSTDTILTRPVVTLLSGPAAGVIGGTFAGHQAGLSDLITIDIGGTSCDVALVRDGKPVIAGEGKIGKYPLRQPMVDVNTIGAGGGSLAWVDGAGGLHVGPQSAGSDPGPACYGWGGERPTVTDASVLLGYLDPDYFAGQMLRLDPGLAEKAVRIHVAEPLGMDVCAAAAGIHHIVNSRMADQLRLVSIQRGYDPRQFSLVALGGAGALHAGRLADLLSIPRVLIPDTPGVLSAFGLLVADIEHEQAMSYTVGILDADPRELAHAYAALLATCLERMRQDRVPGTDLIERRVAEMRYVGQSYELEIPFPDGPVSRSHVDAAVEAFHAQHERIYSHCNRAAAVEFVNLRTVLIHRLPRPALRRRDVPDAPQSDALKRLRRAYFAEHGGYMDTPVYDKSRLRAGHALVGPAIVEQADTTIVLYPGHRATVDDFGNILIATNAAAASGGRKDA
jgi:N-methylhydantoinase A